MRARPTTGGLAPDALGATASARTLKVRKKRSCGSVVASCPTLSTPLGRNPGACFGDDSAVEPWNSTAEPAGDLAASRVVHARVSMGGTVV